MVKKSKNVKSHRVKDKQKSCSIFIKERLVVDEYISNLVNAECDYEKSKWSWGVINAVRLLENCRLFKKKTCFCRQCGSYSTSRKRLAELIIIGGSTKIK